MASGAIQALFDPLVRFWVLTLRIARITSAIQSANMDHQTSAMKFCASRRSQLVIVRIIRWVCQFLKIFSPLYFSVKQIPKEPSYI